MDTGWWAGNLINNGQAPLLAAWVFWVILSICLHELSHGWAALWQGDQTPRLAGHMTINPLVHMGTWSLVAFALTGLAWGAMPVDPSRFRWGRKGDIMVSAAGPAMNFLIAVVMMTALGVTEGLIMPPDELSPVQARVLQFMEIGAYLNLVLGFFNLLPIPPLDGSHILGGFSRRAHEFFQQPAVQTAGLFVMVLILSRVIGGPIATLARDICDAWAGGLARLLAGA